MTTFTTEDRIFTAQYPWPAQPWANAKDYRQAEIPFFWPLTEQIPLGLDYTGCEKPKITTINPVTFSVSNATWSTNISPTLSVKPQNSVGQLNIGGIEIGLEKEPKWHQKVLYKLLGFNWKNKDHKDHKDRK
jgi:hypothetical protein